MRENSQEESAWASSVHKCQYVAFCFLDTPVASYGETSAGFIDVNQASRVQFPVLLYDSPGMVCRSVVNNNNFK